MEEFMDWIIDEHGLIVDFLSFRTAKITLKATIYPDIEKLYHCLHDAQIVRCSLQDVLDFKKQRNRPRTLNEPFGNKKAEAEEEMCCSMNCLDILCDFGIFNTHTLTEEENSPLFLSSIDQSFFHMRLMKKIKKTVKQYPDLRSSIVSLIQKKSMLQMN